MCDSPLVRVQRNWQAWLDIESALKSHVCRHWGDPARAEDVLSGAMEVFVRRHRGDYPRQRQVAFAKMCCRHAARSLAGSGGYWAEYEQVGGKTRRREYISLDDLPGGDLAASTDPESLSHKIGVESRLEALERLLARKGVCQQLSTSVGLLREGANQREAAAAVGWSPVQLHRALRELGRAITGRPAERRRGGTTRDRREESQLPLFSAVDLA